MFHQISKWFKKNSSAPRFFNLLLTVWISDEIRDILHNSNDISRTLAVQTTGSLTVPQSGLET